MMPRRIAYATAWLAALVIGLAAPAALADAWARGDVRAFGAVGDGRADDTAAIHNAVDTLQQGTVYLPPGVYRITAPITLRPGLSLVGEPDRVEVGESTLLAGADMEAMICTPDFGHMLRIESLTIDGGADQGRAIGSCLDLQGFCGSRVGNVRVRNTAGLKTPSVTHACRCTWWLSAEPKWCRKEMPPSLGREALGMSASRVPPDAASRCRSISSRKIFVTAATARGRSARKPRSR